MKKKIFSRLKNNYLNWFDVKLYKISIYIANKNKQRIFKQLKSFKKVFKKY